MRKVVRRAVMMVVSLAVVVASFGLRPMEAKALPVLEDWTDVQAVSTALMAYMESAGMTIMVEADNWQTLASTMWETIADAYVSDVGVEAAGAATGAAWLSSLAPQIALIGGGIVIGAAAGVGMFKLLDWLMDKYFPSGTGEGVDLYSSPAWNIPTTGFYHNLRVYSSWAAASKGEVYSLLPFVGVYDDWDQDLSPYVTYLPGGQAFAFVWFDAETGKEPYRMRFYGDFGTQSQFSGFSFASSAYPVGVVFWIDASSRLTMSVLRSDGKWAFDKPLYSYIGTVGSKITLASMGYDALPPVVAGSSATASVPSAVSAPTIPTGSAMRIDTGVSSSATPEETLQHVGDQIINNTFSPTYTIVLDPSQDPANPPSGEDSGILDWIKSIYYRLTELVTGLAESVSEAIQTALLPSEEFVQELPNRVKTTFADRTGFLTYPISVLVDFVGDLGKYAEEDFIISWPDVAEPISGYTIMEAGSFNMSAMVRDNDSFQTIHDLWFLVAKGMMIIAFLRLCVRKFNSVVGDRMVD